ncbi:MAG: PGPGW domain-containing protein [Minisyncoccia bacterium]
MTERFHKYTLTRPLLKKIVGWFLVIFGFLALVTPLTPGGLLFFVGLEILGIRFVGTEKIKAFLGRKVPVTEVAVTDEKLG